MRNWTMEEMEKLYEEVRTKAMMDADFRKKLLADANGAVEELIGEPLPEGCKLKAIEQDPAYSATFTIPDFVGDELSPDELDKVTGGVDTSNQAVGVSFFVIVSICSLAVGIVGCQADVCGNNLCVSHGDGSGDSCSSRTCAHYE